VPVFLGGDAVMRQPASSLGHRLVTLLVPESYAENLRDLARVLRPDNRSAPPGCLNGGESARARPTEIRRSALENHCAGRSSFSRGRHVPPGRYMRLMRAGKTIMSNTPSEMRDLLEFRQRVTDDVLINGLGLDVAVQIAFIKPEVSTVTVNRDSGIRIYYKFQFPRRCVK
jgi:hypothetical protein